ncbi:MAG: suppressor of fused domain protein [Pirellulales bacterium]
MAHDKAMYLDAREAHYEKYLGAMDNQVMHSTDEKVPDVDIYQFSPTEERPYWTLITGGMSDLPQPGWNQELDWAAPRAELIFYAKEPQGWMFDVVKGLAGMPFENDSFLHWHHTIPNGKAMTPKPSELSSFFIMPPYFEEENFDTLELDGDRVNILWLIPITESEREFAVIHGSPALEELFAEKGLNPVVDEERKSLC